MLIMSQGKRVIEELSNNELSCNGKKQIQSDKIVTMKKVAKKRGRINVNACYRCRRDKKKCDGNYSTKETCRYCRHHKVECSYPEPGRKRVKIVQPHVKDIKIKVKESKKIKKVDIKKDQMKDIHERIIKVEENLVGVTELLSNARQLDIKEIIKQFFFRLLFDETTTIEQALLLRRLWNLIEKIMNYPTCNEEYLYAIYKRLQYLESDQEKIRSQMWKEIQSFVDRYNETNNSCENETSVHSITNSEIISPYTPPSLHVSKSIQPHSFSPIPPEFDYFEELSICHSTVHDPLIVQPDYDNKIKPSPIVPSQRSPRICLKNEDYQEGGISLSDSPNEFSWLRNDQSDSFTFNNNFIPYIDSNSSHNEMNYFQHLTNEGTNFLCFQSTMSSPLFPNENYNIPTFNRLQPSPSILPLNEIEHSYGILSPINSTADYIQYEAGLGIIQEQYPPTSNF
ncbi:hypothetical protein C1645_775285 [Glomus cerebriforme]|uniref:Zn(2)-C6 fungal-type domain-containing protein n=1 Tax=Glomus cerebriforme TaxID=658196 RepID=A0A397SLV6_9GLOM|nr:hypothetical protein C1645_777844 [Glomus cerebriforme]RIA88314.1 hypothetical protein C1645_775285 [Glomus cerebriforme]